MAQLFSSPGLPGGGDTAPAGGFSSVFEDSSGFCSCEPGHTRNHHPIVVHTDRRLCLYFSSPSSPFFFSFQTILFFFLLFSQKWEEPSRQLKPYLPSFPNPDALCRLISCHYIMALPDLPQIRPSLPSAHSLLLRQTALHQAFRNPVFSPLDALYTVPCQLFQ